MRMRPVAARYHPSSRPTRLDLPAPEEPTIAKTSGSARLDEGAIKLAKAGHYNPGTEDGKPVTACINFSIKFQLKN